MEPTPAERYAASRTRARVSDVSAYEATLPFALDDFQRAACEVVAEGRSVLVAAPTGAGKTLVGEYAVRHAHARGEKAFYTAPIKALSNQKFQELRAAYGPEAVGLLTGDTSINGDADIVVMTTEVLRNMIYANSRALDRLGVVVLDEVHYLADRFRGSVWEEVIVHLAARTSIVALSATVSNAEEFGAWLHEVRGDTEVIVSERRPVPLWPHVMLREGIYDLYSPGVDPQAPGPNPRLNPELEAITKRSRHAFAPRDTHLRRGDPREKRGRPETTGRRSPPRFAVVDVLDRNGLLPAIVFVFSRVGCEDAVDQVRSSGIQLTSPEERDRIRAVIDEKCAGLPAEDLGALGFAHWRDHVEAGIAAHHAGMIPLFKEVVEHLFAAGLIRVVYATETLALGINMPARSVVLEKLVKWDGQGHKDLTAGEYTQLTGRAGRRGIDVEGHAVVVEHPGFDAHQLGRLASRRTYPLYSSFHPSYNMTINLVAASGTDRAREVLEMSFAQYQADQSVVSQARAVKELDSSLAGFKSAAACTRGDFMEYASLRERLARSQKDAVRANTRAVKEATAATLAALAVGDAVRIRGGKRSGIALVVAGDKDPVAPRPTVITDGGRTFRLSLADLHHGVDRVGTVRVPKGFDARNGPARRSLAAALSSAKHGFERPSRRARPIASDADADSTDAETLQKIRDAIRSHPCHECSDREDHARWAERYYRALRDKDRKVGEIERATGSIAKVFDKRVAVLTELGYVTPGRDPQPTESGAMLKRLYAENDIAIAECLRNGAWDSLGAPALAAAVSSLMYQGRREDESKTPRVPGGPQGSLGLALTATMRCWQSIEELHKERGLPEPPAPHLGIVGAIHAWAQGKGLDAVLRGSDLAPGDMVRWCKQVIDVLDQVAQVAPLPAVRERAQQAIAAMRRGVVAY